MSSSHNQIKKCHVFLNAGFLKHAELQRKIKSANAETFLKK